MVEVTLSTGNQKPLDSFRYVCCRVLFIILAGVSYAVTPSSRGKQNLALEVSVGKTVGWTFFLVLTLSMAFGLIFVVTELGGFGIQFIWVGLIHALPALSLTLMTGAGSIVLHRDMFHPEPMEP